MTISDQGALWPLASMKPEAIQTDQFWRIDYRLYNPEVAGKSPPDHIRDMLLNLGYQK